MKHLFEAIYENKKTGKRDRMSLADWETFIKHPTIKGNFRLIKKERIPDAAIEAQAQTDEKPKPQKSKKTRKRTNAST